MSDYISRETARQVLTTLLIETALNNTDVNVKDASYVYEDVAKNRLDTWLNLVPISDVRPVVHGEWIYHEPFDIAAGHRNCNECIECSACGTWFDRDCYSLSNYCPNCGADMRGYNNE